MPEDMPEPTLNYEDLDPDPWLMAREWITRFDGSATEMHVLNVSPDRLEALVQLISSSGSVEEAGELSYDYSGEPEDGLNAAARRLAADKAVQLSIITETANIQYQHYIEKWEGCGLSVNVVFWGDFAFPSSAPPERHREAFRRIIQYGLDLCSSGDASSLLLVPETAEPPGELEKKGIGRIWQKES